MLPAQPNAIADDYHDSNHVVPPSLQYISLLPPEAEETKEPYEEPDPMKKEQEPADTSDGAQPKTDGDPKPIRKSIRDIDTDITFEGEDPVDVTGHRFAASASDHLGADGFRPWSDSVYSWRSSEMCHWPTYFSDVNLERYGHSCGSIQPVISAARFCGSVPLIPYLATIRRPDECVYSLGLGRPGDELPFQIDAPPFSLDAAAVEAAAITGAVIVIP